VVFSHKGWHAASDQVEENKDFGVDEGEYGSIAYLSAKWVKTLGRKYKGTYVLVECVPPY
jgi:hypothetical protein